MKILALVPILALAVMFSDAAVSHLASRRRLADELEAKSRSWADLTDRVNSWDGLSDKNDIWQQVKENLDQLAAVVDETGSLYADDASRTSKRSRLERALDERDIAQERLSVAERLVRLTKLFNAFDINKDGVNNVDDCHAYVENLAGAQITVSGPTAETLCKVWTNSFGAAGSTLDDFKLKLTSMIGDGSFLGWAQTFITPVFAVLITPSSPFVSAATYEKYFSILCPSCPSTAAAASYKLCAAQLGGSKLPLAFYITCFSRYLSSDADNAYSDVFSG